MIGRELNTDPRFTVDGHHMPVVLSVDRATEQSGPEAALGRQVGGVEHDDLVGNLHAVILSLWALRECHNPRSSKNGSRTGVPASSGYTVNPGQVAPARAAVTTAVA
jgi:hypothetical protein